MYEPFTDIVPIKPSKPVFNVKTGTIDMKGNTMNDIRNNLQGKFYIKNGDGFTKIFTGDIKSVELEPNENTIYESDIQETSKTFNPKPLSLTCQAKLKPDFVNEEIIKDKPIGPWQIRKIIDRIPRRKHHKARIKKKWAKRYGYWIIEDTFNVKSLEPQDISQPIITYDGELEFVERNVYAESKFDKKKRRN